MKKQLGLQKRLIIIFAIFIVTVSILQTVLAGSIVRRAITAKVMELLQNKATTSSVRTGVVFFAAINRGTTR